MKKITLFVLVAVLILSLFGCSSENTIHQQNYFKNTHSIKEGLYKEIELESITIRMLDDKLIVDKGEKKLSIIVPNSSTGFSEAELSVDGSMLALTVLQHEGSKIYIADFRNDTISLLIDKEFVAHPSWSPNKNQLAFALGKVGSQQIGLWEINSYEELNDFSYISVIGIKWDEKGKYIDFISEETSDKFVLNQLRLDTVKINKIKDLTKSDLNTWLNK